MLFKADFSLNRLALVIWENCVHILHKYWLNNINNSCMKTLKGNLCGEDFNAFLEIWHCLLRGDNSFLGPHHLEIVLRICGAFHSMLVKTSK